MQRIALFFMLCAAVWAAGCSKSPDAGSPSAEAQPQAAPAPIAPPDVAVRQFLEAIRVGDHKQAETMLTAVARQKTMEMDLLVAPPGSPTASYVISGIEVIQNEVAHVGCVWTDTGDDGKPQTNEFVWALRRQSEGWRVAGVAVQMFPNQPPLLLDFENPEDMIRKQQMAEAEFRKQRNPQNIQTGGTPATAAGGGVVPAGATVPSTLPASGGATTPILQGAAPLPGETAR
jgi:hypothetical protein